MATARPIRSFFDWPFTKASIARYPETSASATEEIWLKLSYLADIDSARKNFLVDQGVSRRDLPKASLAFQGYVNQAKTFYEHADVLGYRSASLSYYYSFLNLVKAGLVRREPELATKKIQHGLSFKVGTSRDFRRETLTVVSSGRTVSAFSKFYSHYFNESISDRTALNIFSLLGYNSDIGEQYEQVGGSGKLLPGFWACISDEGTRECWSLIGIAHFKVASAYRKRLAPFLNDYEEVEVNKNDTYRMFGLDAREHNAHTFFQSKRPTPWLAPEAPAIPSHFAAAVIDSLKGMTKINYYNKSPHFYFNVPYRVNNQLLMDETMAIFACMYYLSSLVRYRPDYLEGLLKHEDGWLIENFVRFSPQTFLRAISCWITGEDIIYLRR